MVNFPMDSDHWARGLTVDAYIEEMQNCRRAMRRRVETVRLTPFERNLFSELTATIHALVFTEDWCGDSLMNLPILAQIERIAPGMEVRIFPRPDWPDLQRYFTGRGIQKVPVFAFLDAEFNEIGVWIERPKRANEPVAQWWQAYPGAREIRQRTDLTAEEKRALLRPLTEQFLDAMEDWYDQGLQLETVSEIRQILANYLLE